MCILKGGLLRVGLLGLVWSIGASLVYLFWFGLLGLVWSTRAGLVYRAFVHLPITGQQRATVLEDEEDDAHIHTHMHTHIRQTHRQTLTDRQTHTDR